MDKAEIARALRSLTAIRAHQRPVSIARIADMTGLSRETIYQAAEGNIPPRVQALLSALLPDLMSRKVWTERL